MDLLVFAHRAEAQAFLKNEKWKSITTTPFDLYQKDQSFLLICGEGIENAMSGTTWAATLNPALNRIVNLGVCASVNEGFPVESTHLIRTSYKQNSEKEMVFKSFSTNSDTVIDINTVERRILSHDDANYLDNFAPLVDREFWGVAYSANKLQKELIGIKTVSDIVGKNENICEIVKEEAATWSELLYSKYQSLQESIHITQDDTFLSDERFKNFHFTFSQKQQLLNLSKVIEARGNKTNTFIEENGLFAFNENHRPKDRASSLIKNINDCLYPQEKIINDEIEAIKKNLSKFDIKVSFHPDKETDEFNLNMKVTNYLNLQQKFDAVNAINFKNLFHLFQGRGK